MQKIIIVQKNRLPIRLNFCILIFRVKYELRMFSWDSPINQPTDGVKSAQMWFLSRCPSLLTPDKLKRAVLNRSALSKTEKHRGQTCKDSFWVAFPLYCTEQQVCVSLTSTERDRSTTDPHFSPQREKNLMLDYSWRCKYKPLALFLPLLLHNYSFFFASRAVFIAVEILWTCDVCVWNQYQVRTQTHYMCNWAMQYQCEWPLTPEPPLLCVMYICNAFCLWRQARDGDRVWQNMNWKNISWMTQNHWRNDELLWFQSHPVCTQSSERFGNCRCLLRFFIANDMSVSDLFVEVSVVIFTLWCIRSGWREILIRFSNVVPITEFFLFLVGFSVFLYYRCNLVVFIFVCWDEGRCRPRLLSALSPSLFFIPFL